MSHADKLAILVAGEGFASLDDLLEACITDAVCPAICCNPNNRDCNYTEELEPDQDRGWCPECQAGTMKSALVLAGII